MRHNLDTRGKANGGREYLPDENAERSGVGEYRQDLEGGITCFSSVAARAALRAAERETIKKRNRVARIGVNSVVMEGTQFKHEQTPPLHQEAAG